MRKYTNYKRNKAKKQEILEFILCICLTQVYLSSG